MLKALLLIVSLSGAATARADTYTTLTLPTLNTELRSALAGAPFVPLFPSIQT